MADMTREEVDAKIVANEARSDAQVAAILAKIDGIIARMDAFEREMRETTRDIVAEMKNLKKTITITVISSALAVIFGVASLNASLLNNMIATFESGKEMGQLQNQISKQAAETAKQAAETAKQAAETNQILTEIRRQLAADALEREKLKQARKSERN